MRPAALSAAKERILLELKTKGPRTSAQLARRLHVSQVAVRQHLVALEASGLTEFDDRRGKVGRPTRVWRLADSPAVAARFPDSHADLAMDLLSAARRTFGTDGLDRLARERARRQARAYAARIRRDDPLRKRVAALAALRRDEGYMAQWRAERGGFLLIENHCPICAAAEICQGLCRAELELFRDALGGDAVVERTEHVLEGARRCVYRIRETPGRKPPDQSPRSPTSNVA